MSDESAPKTASNDANTLELAEAKSAFLRGDFATVRRLCLALEQADDVALASKARTLRGQTQSDVVQNLVLAACGLFFVLSVWRYFF